ncbi:centrosomal protein of 85 kDa-like isoform X1 [Hydra vulgaris]|uniref:centrosomal protein of 85 kDa-like isoform X1 n=1 Tax=Hydra vulgaris TaxID=6087 RepID=UPI001F5E9E08|nr:centrosomal protein of 85 kDa-like [Hydra vulgaris]
MDNGDPFVELIPQDITISAPSLIEKNSSSSVSQDKYGVQNVYVTPCKFSTSLGERRNLITKNDVTEATNGLTVLDQSWSHKTNSVLSSQQDYLKIDHFQELFAVKNNIIEQKDIIMQKQKTIINQLRQTNLELEELLIQKQEEIQASGLDSLVLQVREYKYENSQLKQKLTQINNSKYSDVEKLQKKLGECEYEHSKLKTTMKEMEISKVTEVSKLQQQLEMKEHILSMEQRKSETYLRELKEAKQENTKLQLYLEELPTSDEYKSIKNEVKSLKKDKDTAMDEIDFIKKKNAELREEISKKDSQSQELLKTINKLKDEITRLSTSLESYKQQDEKGPFSLKEFQDAITKIKFFESENTHLKKSLEKRHKKLNRLHYDLLEKDKLMEEQKTSYENTIRLLTDDLKNKNLSITKVNAQNQEIMSSSLDYQKELKKYKDCYTQEYMDSFNILFKEICKCADDVRSFVKLCSSRVKGKEPDLNALLGLHDSPEKSQTIFQSVLLPTLDTLRLKFSEIADVRKEVDGLRRSVCEHYAQEIGNNMCISQ